MKKNFNVTSGISITGRNTRSIDRYLKELNRYKVLTPEEELAFAIKAADGDESARESLINHNLRFVVSVAKTYVSKRNNLEDLISEGNAGLVYATDRFDYKTGNKLISYAVWWIHSKILKHLMNNETIRIPSNKHKVLMKIHRSMDTLQKTLGREPTNGEIADYIDEPVNIVDIVIASSVPVSSLDFKFSNDADAGTLIDVVPIEDDVNKLELLDGVKVILSNALKTITPREQEVVKLYYGLNGVTPKSLDEIGERFGLTRERVRQIKNNASRRLKQRVHHNEELKETMNLLY
jgi:RNA polymerase primary sigma factor